MVITDFRDFWNPAMWLSHNLYFLFLLLYPQASECIGGEEAGAGRAPGLG